MVELQLPAATDTEPQQTPHTHGAALHVSVADSRRAAFHHMVCVFARSNPSGTYSRKQEVSGPTAHVYGITSVTCDNEMSKCKLYFIFFISTWLMLLTSDCCGSCLGPMSGTQTPVKHCNSLPEWKCITINSDVKAQCVVLRIPRWATTLCFANEPFVMSLWRKDNLLLSGSATCRKVKTQESVYNETLKAVEVWLSRVCFVFLSVFFL